ncbi:C1 family peptidase [Brevundimonas fluminis]|jgi:hypothetical protein|uniref:C1 family peptidase n=1 Tax=Brevundimonas fluminis TaxID=2487274 RepID=UPI000F6568A5|nr:C1 family peptidase [Brevundimonas fluminis]
MTRTGIALLALIGAALGAPAAAQDRPTGLQFVPRAEYQSIPLASRPFAGEDLPASVDLSQYMPPPGDQGDQNSCVGWAVAYAVKSYQEQRELRWSFFEGGSLKQERIFSPSYVYNQINNGMNVGTLFPHALNLVAEHGAAPLSSMPYSRYDAQVSANAHAAAKRYRIDTWRTVNAQAPMEVKAQIAAGFPVMIGAEVDEGFSRLSGAQMWRAHEGAVKGGHAMVVVGYDDARKAFRLINSWGTGWGDGGYVWVTYEHFVRVVREAYVALDAKNGPADGPTVVPGPAPTPQPPTNVQPVQPPAAAAGIVVNQMVHNQVNPMFGPGVMIHGVVQVPPGVQGLGQVILTVTYQNGQPVPGLNPAFVLPNGQAATAAGQGGQVMLSNQPQTIPWSAFLPYCALGVPKGQMCLNFPIGPPQTSLLTLRPVFFINGFGVAEGQPQNWTLIL